MRLDFINSSHCFVPGLVSALFLFLAVSCSPNKDQQPEKAGADQPQQMEDEKTQDVLKADDVKPDNVVNPAPEAADQIAPEAAQPDEVQPAQVQPDQVQPEADQAAKDVPESEADRQKDLAIDPKTCKITHCQSFPGFEQNGLKCETDKILKADYKSGDETFKIVHVQRYIQNGDDSGECNGENVTAVDCYLSESDYARAYRKAGFDFFDKPTFYIYDESLCDEAVGMKKDLAVDPRECMVTHCKNYPGYEENGLECQTEAILKAGLNLGLQSPHFEILKYSGASCHDSSVSPEKTYQCFLTEQEMLKACKKLGRDKCNDKDEDIRFRGWAEIVDKSACAAD